MNRNQPISLRAMNARLAAAVGVPERAGRRALDMIMRSNDPAIENLQGAIRNLPEGSISFGNRGFMDIKQAILAWVEDPMNNAAIFARAIPQQPQPPDLPDPPDSPPKTPAQEPPPPPATPPPASPQSPNRGRQRRLTPAQRNRIIRLVAKYGPVRSQTYFQMLGPNLDEQDIDRINSQTIPQEIAHMSEFLPVPPDESMNRWGYPIGPRLLGKRYIDGIR